MSLLPAFQIGIWNAWILLLYYPLHPILLLLIDRLVGTGDIMRKLGGSEDKGAGDWASTWATAVTVVLLLYSIFLPLKLGSAWLHIGLAVYLFGLAMFLWAGVSVATTPPGEPFFKGAYRYSRHPLYLSTFCTFLGAGIAAASWLFVLLAVLLIVLFAVYVGVEERACTDRYGDSYRAYRDRTPRWFGIPK